MKHRHKKKTYSGYIISAVVLAAIILVIILLNKGGVPAGKSNVVSLDLYVMSQCPYGVQAEDLIIPVVKQFGNSVDFNLNFIASDSGSGNFDSLHGENEVKGDIVELCAMKKEPQKYMDIILCMNENAAGIPGNWEECSKKLNLDTAAIKSCYEGSEGKQLLSDSIKKSNSANAGASPTIIINGQEYSGQRDGLSITRAICQYSASSLCKNMPACTADADCPAKEGKVPQCRNPDSKNAVCEYVNDAKTELVIVNDKRCSSCDTTQIVAALKNIFLNLDAREVDSSSEEGKKLIADMGITVAPSFVFDSNVVQTYAWKNNPKLQSAFEQKNGKYRIVDEATGASFYIDEKARQEFLKSIGITPGDNRPQIDFFVMAYCPYGNQAEQIIDAVYANLKDKADFNPHYVIYSNYQSADYCLDSTMKYCSMHGNQELHQDVRELCVNKYVGIKSWFDFAIAMNGNCSYQNADSCWEDVAKSLNLDVQKIKDCEANESESLLEKEQKLGDMLGVQGSPTIFIDGVQYGGARDANSIQSALCSAFDTKPSECSNTITGTAATSASGGCG